MAQQSLPILSYRAYRPPPWPWRRLLRAVLHGPLTGAAVGLTQASAALIVCCSFGKDYPYFRGSGVMLYALLTFGGGLIGVPYGLAISAYEWLRRQRTQLAFVFPFLIVIAGAAEAVSTMLLLEHPEPFNGWTFYEPQMVAVTVGLVLSLAAARSVT